VNETTAVHGRKVRERILDAIISYIEEHGYPPTVREISDMVGLKSTSSTQSHLIRMKADGMIETDAPEFSTRAIRVPGYKFVKEENR
jgi:repressor LexA